MMKKLILTAIAVVAIASVTANAALQITGVNSTDATAYAGDISGTDLANGQGVSIWNNWHAALPVAGLTDGPSGTIAWALDPSLESGNMPADWHWTLDTVASPDGYDITEIQSISSWAEAYGWSNQAYNVYYTTVDAPDAWTALASVNYQPFTDSQAGATKVNITDDAGGVLLTGVDKIWIHFAATTSTQPGTIYDEVDIFGAPSVPEPATLSLLAIGGLTLLRRRK